MSASKAASAASGPDGGAPEGAVIMYMSRDAVLAAVKSQLQPLYNSKALTKAEFVAAAKFCLDWVLGTPLGSEAWTAPGVAQLVGAYIAQSNTVAGSRVVDRKDISPARQGTLEAHRQALGNIRHRMLSRHRNREASDIASSVAVAFGDGEEEDEEEVEVHVNLDDGDSVDIDGSEEEEVLTPVVMPSEQRNDSLNASSRVHRSRQQVLHAPGRHQPQPQQSPPFAMEIVKQSPPPKRKASPAATHERGAVRDRRGENRQFGDDGDFDNGDTRHHQSQRNGRPSASATDERRSSRHAAEVSVGARGPLRRPRARVVDERVACGPAGGTPSGTDSEVDVPVIVPRRTGSPSTIAGPPRSRQQQQLHRQQRQQEDHTNGASDHLLLKLEMTELREASARQAIELDESRSFGADITGPWMTVLLHAASPRNAASVVPKPPGDRLSQPSIASNEGSGSNTTTAPSAANANRLTVVESTHPVTVDTAQAQVEEPPAPPPPSSPPPPEAISATAHQAPPAVARSIAELAGGGSELDHQERRRESRLIATLYAELREKQERLRSNTPQRAASSTPTSATATGHMQHSQLLSPERSSSLRRATAVEAARGRLSTASPREDMRRSVDAGGDRVLVSPARKHGASSPAAAAATPAGSTRRVEARHVSPAARRSAASPRNRGPMSPSDRRGRSSVGVVVAAAATAGPTRPEVVEFMRQVLQPHYDSGLLPQSAFVSIVKNVSNDFFGPTHSWRAGNAADDAAWQAFLSDRLEGHVLRFVRQRQQQQR